MATYYVRADGTVLAADKANATDPAAAATSLNMAQVNAATFSAGDSVLFSSQGGNYNAVLIIPSGGSGVGSEITYANVPTETPVINPATDKYINANGKNYTIISGFSLQHTSGSAYWAVWVETGSYIALNNITVNFTPAGCGGIAVHGTASYVTVTNCFSTAKIHAFYVGDDAHHVTITGCEGVSLTTNGVLMENAVHDVLVTNSEFHDCSGTGIEIEGTSNLITVTYNDIHDCATNGVAPINSTHDITIAYNSIWNIGYWASAANGTGIIPHNSATAISSYYNLIWNCKNSGIGDVSTGTNTFYNNVSWNCGYAVDETFPGFGGQTVTTASVRGGVYFDKPSGMATIKNNVMVGGYPCAVCDEHVAYTDFDYNCYDPVSDANFYSAVPNGGVYDSWTTYSANEPHSINADPLMVNPTTDFSLGSISPCINAGVDVSLTTDFLGHSIVGLPDIGAYEYPWVPKIIMF
jgi:hypothetical protein